LKRLVEDIGGEAAHDQLIDAWGAAKEGFIDGGIAGGVRGGPLSAAGGAIVSGVASGASTYAAGKFLPSDELAALPSMLSNDPEKAIKLIESVGDLNAIARGIAFVLGGAQLLPKLGYSTTDAALGAGVSEARQKLDE
jgi:hypothetical protein